MVVGGLDAQDKTGLRVSVTGGESFAMLFEISSGNLLAVMGYPFSNLRIGATVALAVERFTSPEARNIALIGSGRLALPILQAAAAVRPAERVQVYSRNTENRNKFAYRAAEQLKLEVIAVASAQQAIEGADFILVSTNSQTAALSGEWLKPGLSVFGVGRPNEFDDAVYLHANLICVTSKAHELEYYDKQLDQPLIRLSREQKISWNAVVELGEILTGNVSPPDRSGSIVVFRDSQGGYGDIALAAWAYEEARRRGIGQDISTE